ncbi:MAG: heavy-metal-associated domain-containing protein [Pseudomonadota bacterium]
MMKSAFTALAIACLSAPAFPQAELSVTEKADAPVIARVNGMVCDFCAQAVTKVFGREDAVQRVEVDLNDGAIRIAMKPGEDLDDARIAELIKKSGYALVEIERPAA